MLGPLKDRRLDHPLSGYLCGVGVAGGVGGAQTALGVAGSVGVSQWCSEPAAWGYAGRRPRSIPAGHPYQRPSARSMPRSGMNQMSATTTYIENATRGATSATTMAEA